MTALISPVRIPTTPRRQRASVTAALGLSAGAVGWSGLANAAGEETASQVLLLPEHYELLDNGVVALKLETGGTLSLTEDQYLIMEDGLLLITDELAQASVYSLPVMGSVRAQLMSDVQPVRSPDGSVVLASDDSPLWSGDGPAPRLFEQVDLQRYEIAQASDGSSNEVSEAVAVGVGVGVLSPGAIALLGLLMTSNQISDAPPDQVSDAPPQPHPYAGQFVKLDDIHPGADINDVGDTDPGDFAVLDGKLYFSGEEPDGDDALYMYDPLTGETIKVASADVTPVYSAGVLGGKLYFGGRGGDGLSELYVHDPDNGSTLKVPDFHPSADTSGPSGSTSPREITGLDGKLYMRAEEDGSYGAKLFVYDPSDGTTNKVLDADPYSIEALDGKLYFRNNSDGYGLTMFDPSTLETSAIAGGENNPTDLHAMDGKLYFDLRLSDDIPGPRELHVYDPSDGIVQQVSGADLSGPDDGTSPDEMHALGGKLYFFGDTPSYDDALAVYDPDDGTTSLIDGYDLKYPEDLIDMNGALYFNAEDISGDSEIYVYFPDDLTV